MANQFTEEFKKKAVQYYKGHSELGYVKCAKNLGIGKTSLSKWVQQYDQNDNEIPTRGSGNYESDEAKEIARLKKELRDTQDALDI